MSIQIEQAKITIPTFSVIKVEREIGDPWITITLSDNTQIVMSTMMLEEINSYLEV